MDSTRTFFIAGAATLIDTNDSELSVIPSNCGTTVVGETANFDSPSVNEPTKEKKDDQIFKTPVKGKNKNGTFFCAGVNVAAKLMLIFLPPAHTKIDSKQNDVETARSYEMILDNIKLMNMNKCDHLLDGCKVREKIRG